MISVKNYTEPPICEKEILRYAGCKSSEEELLQLLHDCLEEARPRLNYKVCYIELPVSIAEDVCDFGCMKVQSKDLVKNLQGCEKAILFGATVGVEIDRLIAKYSRISPTKALMFQAIGAERIEALCDAFCEEIENETRPRYSPGYGDVPLTIQQEVFAILNCGKNIGLVLNDSLLMSPSKSVTAFVGVGESQAHTANNEHQLNKCAVCNNIDCLYREI